MNTALQGNTILIGREKALFFKNSPRGRVKSTHEVVVLRDLFVDLTPDHAGTNPEEEIGQQDGNESKNGLAIAACNSTAFVS